MAMKPHKWGASHTEEKNLVKGLPGYLKGAKVVGEAIDELIKMEFLLRLKKTGQWHVSLNPRKKGDIQVSGIAAKNLIFINIFS